jgi:ubiquinone/menaquinone biosynthesis C-methylase UbiE
MFMQARALQRIAPHSVLEVGAGFGVKLFSLASMIGGANFTGIELTESGVARAKAMQAQAQLPEDMVRYLPLPLADPQAFKRADMRQGDAQALPFADNSFDLVYTHRALEQMDMIRDRAMAEIARVSRCYAVFIEPFAEFNTASLPRNYLNAKDYFRMKLAELPRFGLEVVHRDADLPQKIVNRIGLVVARKR